MSTKGKKLARVEHIRCGEYTASTYVWVPLDMSEEEFQERVDAAEKEYLAALKEFSEKEKPSDGFTYQINWEKQRDKNVGEVLDEHAAKKAEKAIYAKSRQDALKGFDHFLERQEGIESFWSVGADLTGEVDWGHAHGTKIVYGETDWPKFTLLKASQRGRPGGQVTVLEHDEEWA